MSFIVFIVVILIISCVVDNSKRRRLDSKIEESRANLEEVLKKRYDVLTKALAAAEEYVKAEDEFVKTIEIHEGMSIEEMTDVSQQLDNMSSVIHMAAETYPELCSSEVFKELQSSIANSNGCLQSARRLYNEDVTNYRDCGGTDHHKLFMATNTERILSGEKLNALVDEHKEKSENASNHNLIGCGGAIAVSFVTFLICVGSMGTESDDGAIVLGSICAVALGIMALVLQRSLCSNEKEAVKARKESAVESIIMPILCSTFSEVHYAYNDHVQVYTSDDISGNNHVIARYKDVPIEFSNLKLTRDADEAGTIIDFWGIKLRCNFNMHFPTDLVLQERNEKITNMKKIPKTSYLFSRQFPAHAADVEQACHILTPYVMERIKAIKEKSDGEVSIQITAEGKIFLAVNAGYNLFEIDTDSPFNAESLREQFSSEVRYVTELIDELKLIAISCEQ